MQSLVGLREPAQPPPRRTPNVLRLFLFSMSCFLVFTGVAYFVPFSHNTSLTDRTTTNAKPHAEIVRIPLTPTPTTDESPMDAVKSFFSHAPPVECPKRVYTLAELNQFNTPQDLLIVVNTMVLNVTRFYSRHPGGPAIMQGASGVDAAAQFSHYHQPGTVGLFRSFCVGTYNP